MSNVASIPPVSLQVIILWRREKLRVSFDYLEGGWFSDGDDLQHCKQRLVHMIDARLQSADVLPFVVQLPQEFIDEHAKVCVKFKLLFIRNLEKQVQCQARPLALSEEGMVEATVWFIGREMT